MLSLSIVCGAYDEKLTITGSGYVRVDEEIRVIGLTKLSIIDGGFETYNSRYGKKENYMYVTLPELTSTVTYQVTVQNTSNHIYVISDIASDLRNSDIGYEIENYKIGQPIGKKETITFNITFKYKGTTLPADKTQTAAITYTFVRPYAEILIYDNNESKSKCQNVQCALDDLYEKLGG